MQFYRLTFLTDNKSLEPGKEGEEEGKHMYGYEVVTLSCLRQEMLGLFFFLAMPWGQH